MLPTFNRSATIVKAIASVTAQSQQDLELIVVDDGSTDDTASIVRELILEDERIQLISLDSNSGAATARNVGIRASSGQLLAFLDSDDWWASDKLSHDVAFAEGKEHSRWIAHTGTVVVFQGRQELRPSRPLLAKESILEYLLTDGFIQTSSVFGPRSTLSGNNLWFDPDLTPMEDWKFYVDAQMAGLEVLFTRSFRSFHSATPRPDRLSHASRRNAGEAWIEKYSAQMTTRERELFELVVTLPYEKDTAPFSTRFRSITLALAVRRNGIRFRGVLRPVASVMLRPPYF